MNRKKIVSVLISIATVAVTFLPLPAAAQGTCPDNLALFKNYVIFGFPGGPFGIRPEGIDMDGSGNLYVTDINNNKAYKIDQSGGLLKTYTLPVFSFPWGMQVATSGDVYVGSDQGIHVFSNSGALLSTIGSFGSGDGQFQTPIDMALDATGNLYVTDYTLNRVQKFHSNGTLLLKWGSSGTGDGQFSGAWGLGVDSAGNVFVSEFFGSRVQKFDSDGNFLLKWGTFGTGTNQFYQTKGIGIDPSDNVYVGDDKGAFPLFRVQRFDNFGTFHSETTVGLQQTPGDVVVAPNGDVFVSIDAPGASIQRFGCPDLPPGDYKDILTFSLQTLGQGTASFAGIEGAELRVFNMDDPAFRAAYGPGYGHWKRVLNNIYNGTTGLISSCTTDINGGCTAYKQAAGNYLVVGRYSDTEDDKTIYTSQIELAADFNADKENFADLKIVKKYKNDGTIDWGPGGHVLVVAGAVASLGSNDDDALAFEVP